MSTSRPTTRPIFDPVDTTFHPAEHAVKDEVESPSLTSGNALARFEFEPGRSKDGTKVLMVEWEDDDTTSKAQGEWEISWEGKRTVLPAKDQTSSEPREDVPVNRLYFLLGPGVAIPTVINLRKGAISWHTSPLPAIFAPELGASARQAGKKGVLHTIWAKKRLQVLQNEIDSESKYNAEGIGLEMAMAEKEWIEQNFGVATKPSSISIPTQASIAAANLNGPQSPRSPGGGRLMDKLKGLRIGTGAQDLNANGTGSGSPNPLFNNPLSPESSDVAVGSFGSFAALKGMPPPSHLAAKPAQSSQSSQSQPRMVVQRPPESFVSRQQQQQQGGMSSLNALAGGDPGFSRTEAQNDGDDDLFALPMSPRSPEMTKSPFSFGAQDTQRYLKG